MPELERKKDAQKKNTAVNNITLEGQDKKRILSVIESEISTQGLEERYVRRLKKLEHKLISFERASFSDKERSLLTSVLEAFVVLAGQKWNTDRIIYLNSIYRRLGGRRWLTDDWMYWKILFRKRKKICPTCGQEIK